MVKVGIRKPSVKKSIKARTTGKATRAIKSSVNPTYGKTGMGWINDPKKAAYNKVYKSTTKSVFDLSGKENTKDNLNSNLLYEKNGTSKAYGVVSFITGLVTLFFVGLTIFSFVNSLYTFGVFCILLSLVELLITIFCYKRSN